MTRADDARVSRRSFPLLAALGLAAVLAACGGEKAHGPHDGHDHDHGDHSGHDHGKDGK